MTFADFFDIKGHGFAGLAIYGGVIGAAITIFIMQRVYKFNILSALDITSIGFLIGQGIGRWGNFVNQEAFGPLIKYPGMISDTATLNDAALIAQREFLSKLLIPNFIIDRMYIPYSSASGWTVAGYYHPTFLYESVFNVIGVLLYTNLRKYIKKLF
jgi:phosphatidylglycerol:prolipoprotein diacylglycerol transferase